MQVGFAGTPVFAATVLARLLDAGFAVPLVITQPDRPRGRGQKLLPSPVKRLAAERGIAVHQPATLASEEARAALVAVPLDVLAVAAYGLILPPAILAWPRRGCINVHASLLPRWRGAAPIQRALLAGDVETGVTIMQMDAGLDTGPMFDIVRLPIDPRETCATLETRLAEAGADALVQVLRRLADGAPVPPTPQAAGGATYAAKIGRSEAAIDWRSPAMFIDRQVRAFDPVPGARTALGGEIVKIWRAEVATRGTDDRDAIPGSVLALGGTGILVACGEGALRLLELQPADGRRMSTASFAAGRRLAPGARFDVATKAPIADMADGGARGTGP